MKKLLYALLVLAIFTACKKKINARVEPQKPDNPCGLPNASQTGAGVLAACINDTSWIVAVDSIPGTNDFLYNDNSISFGGVANVGQAYYIMDFYMGYIKQGSTYTLTFSNFLNNKYPYCGVQTDFNPCELTYDAVTIFEQSGSVTITKADTTHKIISGTFSFDMPIFNCDTLHVRYGRFDLKSE